jgi:hypothetical protein
MRADGGPDLLSKRRHLNSFPDARVWYAVDVSSGASGDFRAPEVPFTAYRLVM